MFFLSSSPFGLIVVLDNSVAGQAVKSGDDEDSNRMNNNNSSSSSNTANTTTTTTTNDNNRNNNGNRDTSGQQSLTATFNQKQADQPGQNAKQTHLVLSQEIHDGSYNITVLPIPQYDQNTSAKLAPLFAYLNGDKVPGKKGSSDPLPVPQDSQTVVNRGSGGVSVKVGGQLGGSNSPAAASGQWSTAAGRPSDSYHAATAAVDSKSTQHLSGAASAQDSTKNVGYQAHDTPKPVGSGVASRPSTVSQAQSPSTGFKVGTTDANPSVNHRNTPGLKGGQTQTKEPSGMHQNSQETNATPQAAVRPAADKLDDVLPKQEKQLCLTPRHDCPTPARVPRPGNPGVNMAQKQRDNSDSGDASLEEKNKAHWGAMMDLARQIQRANDEVETMKTLKEKVHTLEVLSNALTTLTSKYFLGKGPEEDESEADGPQGIERTHRHRGTHHSEISGSSRANMLKALLVKGRERLPVADREKNLKPKDVAVLESKINQAIIEAEASNRQSVSRRLQNAGVPSRPLPGMVADQASNAHARGVSSKLRSQPIKGPKDAGNSSAFIEQLAKLGQERGKADGGHRLESIVQNVASIENGVSQNGRQIAEDRVGTLFGRGAREPEGAQGSKARDEGGNMTRANKTMTLTATDTVSTPGRGITLGGRINTEAPLHKKAPGDIDESLLKAMGSVLNQRTKSADCRGKLECGGLKTTGNKSYPESGHRVRPDNTSALKPGLAGAQRDVGTEQGVKYTDVMPLRAGKRLQVRSDKFEQNLKTMSDLEEGIEKLITKLPKDQRQSGLQRTAALRGAPTVRGSSGTEVSPNKAVRLLQNIAGQLRKTVYLLDKNRAGEADRVRQEQHRGENGVENERIGYFRASELQKGPEAKAFAESTHKIHVIRERPKTQNALGSSTIPHVVEFHSGVTMGRIASPDATTSGRDATTLPEDKVMNVPQFQSSDGKAAGKVIVGGSSPQPVTHNPPIQSDKNDLLLVPQLSSLANGSQAGSSPISGPTRGTGNGASEEETAQLSVALSTGPGGGGGKGEPTSISRNGTEVKELLRGISSLVKLLSLNRKSEAGDGDEENEEDSLQTGEGSPDSVRPITAGDADYTSPFTNQDEDSEPVTNQDAESEPVTNQDSESEPDGENVAADDYQSEQNGHFVNSDPDESNTGSRLTHLNEFEAERAGGAIEDGNRDVYINEGRYSDAAYPNHAGVGVGVKGAEAHSNWDRGYGHVTKKLRKLSNQIYSHVDPLLDYHPTKKSPLLEEYENLPSQIRDLNDPRLKDEHVLDDVQGMIDRQTKEEAKELTNLRPERRKVSTAKKSLVQRKSLVAVAPPKK